MPYTGASAAFEALVKDDPSINVDRRAGDRPSSSATSARDGTRALGRGLDRVQGRLMGGERFAGRFLIPGGLWLLCVLRRCRSGSSSRSRSARPTTSATRSTAGTRRTTRASSTRCSRRSCCARSATRSPPWSLCLLIGYPVAYYIARFGGRWKNMLIALVIVPLVRQLPRAHVRVGRDARRRGPRQRDRARPRPDDRRHPVPQHAVGGDRRARLRLHRVHDPAGLRRAGPDGPGAHRGRQGPLRLALADLPPRHLADDLPGRAGRHGARLPARGRRLRHRRSCSAGRTRS